MKRSLNYTLIETTVRNAIKQIKDDPERNIRKLVDMALTFSNGRFQQYFFKSAQKMLESETSCYYKLVPDIIQNVDTERIITFGMNVGYHSCTKGAEKIREIESMADFNIPWCLFLELNGDDYCNNPIPYHYLIQQGIDLGIYTWLIASSDNPLHILKLIKAFPDCAFLIFCSAKDITPALLDETASIYNIMFVVKYEENIQDICTLLRNRKYLYSVYDSYTRHNEKKIFYDEILCDTANLHAAFTFFCSDRESLTKSSLIYEHILQTRRAQTYPSVPFDLIHDTHYIDSIISDQPCSVFFTRDGNCYSLTRQTLYKDCNYFSNTLYEIFQKLALQK